jgi:pyrroloquinoline quinone biosynthesis protein D
MPDRPKLAPHVRRQIDRVTGGAMLLHPEGAVELSASADAIVRLCDGRRSLHEIVAALAEEFSADPAELRADATACLAQLTARGLLA